MFSVLYQYIGCSPPSSSAQDFLCSSSVVFTPVPSWGTDCSGVNW
jgi:hypothetical protein